MTDAVRRLIRQLWTLVVLVAAVDFVFGASFVYQMQHSGVSAGWIGAMVAAATLMSTVLEVPSGAWGDRYGQRRILVAGLCLWSGGLVVFGLARGVPWFTAGLALWALGMSLYSGAPMSLVVNQLRRAGAEAHVAAAVRGAQVARWLAAAAGAGLAAVTGAYLPAHWLIVASGFALGGGAAWVRWRWTDDVPATAGGVGATLVRGIRDALGAPIRGTMMLAAASAATLALLLISWQPLAGAHGVPVAGFGVILLVFTIAVAIGAWASRFLGTAPGPLPVTLLLAAMTTGLAVAGVTQSRLLAGVGFLVAELCSGAAGTLVMVRAQAVFTDAVRNTLTSLMSTVQGVAMAVTEATFGLLWQDLGVRRALGWIGAAMTVFLLAGASGYASARLIRIGGRPLGTLQLLPVAGDQPAPRAPEDNG